MEPKDLLDFGLVEALASRGNPLPAMTEEEKKEKKAWEKRIINSFVVAMIVFFSIAGGYGAPETLMELYKMLWSSLIGIGFAFFSQMAIEIGIKKYKEE